MLEPPAAAAGDSKNRDAAMHKLGSALRRPSNLIQGMLPDALPKDVVVVGDVAVCCGIGNVGAMTW